MAEEEPEEEMIVCSCHTKTKAEEAEEADQEVTFIQCESCLTWFCLVCSGYSEDSEEFFCQECVPSVGVSVVGGSRIGGRAGNSGSNRTSTVPHPPPPPSKRRKTRVSREDEELQRVLEESKMTAKLTSDHLPSSDHLNLNQQQQQQQTVTPLSTPIPTNINNYTTTKTSVKSEKVVPFKKSSIQQKRTPKQRKSPKKKPQPLRKFADMHQRVQHMLSYLQSLATIPTTLETLAVCAMVDSTSYSIDDPDFEWESLASTFSPSSTSNHVPVLVGSDTGVAGVLKEALLRFQHRFPDF